MAAFCEPENIVYRKEVMGSTELRMRDTEVELEVSSGGILQMDAFPTL